jgi:hypothetical protein
MVLKENFSPEMTTTLKDVYIFLETSISAWLLSGESLFSVVENSVRKPAFPGDRRLCSEEKIDPLIEGKFLSPSVYVIGLLYVGFLYALYYAVREPRGTWPYRMLFQVTYNLFISPFLSLFAWATIRRESWMTR